MKVELGPVPVRSARAWLEYGRQVVAALGGDPAAPSARPEVLARFDRLLDAWTDACDAADRAGAPFRWAGDEEPDRVEFLLKALYETGLRVEERHASGAIALRPAAADAFHIMLIQASMDALVAEGPAHAQFVDGLRAVWRIANRT